MKLLLLSSVWLLLACSIGLSDEVASKNPPNVIIVLVDDLGWRDLGCYGSTFYQTPNIDDLAKQSVRFTQFYSAHPVCSPTRAALMTGKAPQRVGIVDWIPHPSDIHLPHVETTIGEAFQQAGYDTGYIGKWHLGEADDQQPDSHGFAWQRCVNRGGQPGSYFFPFQRTLRKNAPLPRPTVWDVPDLENGQPGDYLTDGLTDKAIEFVEAKRTKPFFLCLSYYTVHTPIQGPPELVKQYREAAKQLPAAPPDRDEKNGATSRGRQDDPGYAAMVERLDTNVGRLLKSLERDGLSKDTIVVFTSDNGGFSTTKGYRAPTSTLPLRAGKAWCYEGGIRIPTLIRYPKKRRMPRVCSTPAVTMDLYPTLLELAGVEMKPTQHLDGVSLKDTMFRLLDDQMGVTENDRSPRLLGWHYPVAHSSGHRPSTAIRVGNQKLIHFHETDTYELYDLMADPYEQNDLSESDALSKTVTVLKQQMQDWVQETTGVKSIKNVPKARTTNALE